MTTRFTFWVAAALIAYVYFGYPALLFLLSLVVRRPHQKQAFEPKVSLLVAAYNEASIIEAKVRNALALDYAADRLEIVIASDGSSDGTPQIVRRLMEGAGRGRVRLLDFPENRGKITALNQAVRQLQGDIIVFSDASSMLESDSIRHLMANFADPRVGAASGVYRVLKQDQARLGYQEDFYWKYETFLKLQEAKLGCVLGAHGSMFAVRKELYPFPAPNLINDDFIIPIRVLQRGFRVAYDPSAVAYEEAHEMEGFGRRVRIARGNVEQLAEIRGMLRPLRPVSLICFLSHKAGRLIVPLAMVVLVVSNAFLWRSPTYASLGLAQVLFYSLALGGALVPLRPKVLRLPYYFCMINAALFAWIYLVVCPRRSANPRGAIWTG
jgi:cellulose synthase/poly-beta-1,6-N-acetylglucosamine synthase-like glycosyltransferase